MQQPLVSCVYFWAISADRVQRMIARSGAHACASKHNANLQSRLHRHETMHPEASRLLVQSCCTQGVTSFSCLMCRTAQRQSGTWGC